MRNVLYEEELQVRNLSSMRKIGKFAEEHMDRPVESLKKSYFPTIEN
jgi:hypothetical protein